MATAAAPGLEAEPSAGRGRAAGPLAREVVLPVADAEYSRAPAIPWWPTTPGPFHAPLVVVVTGGEPHGL